MEKNNKKKLERDITCRSCKKKKPRKEFYKDIPKAMHYITQFCRRCRDRISEANKSRAERARFIPRIGLINKSSPFHKIITKSVYKDEFDYIMVAQKYLTNVHLIIRQMIEDRVRVRELETMVIWNDFLLELQTLNKAVEGYKKQK